MALILGFESTCDETGAAVVRDGRAVLSNIVATQVDLHARYRGVVPEIASRAHIQSILPVIRESLDRAGSTLDQLDAIAVAHRPGLIGSLLIGVTAANAAGMHCYSVPSGHHEQIAPIATRVFTSLAEVEL
jgi:N6-L-threonylcarbamoyladenine synthase